MDCVTYKPMWGWVTSVTSHENKNKDFVMLCYVMCSRLLHSSSLVTIGLSVEYETWFPIDWHDAFVIGWSKYKLGLPSSPLPYGFT